VRVPQKVESAECDGAAWMKVERGKGGSDENLFPFLSLFLHSRVCVCVCVCVCVRACVCVWR